MSFNVEATLCPRLGEPLSAFSGCRLVTRHLVLNLPCCGQRLVALEILRGTWPWLPLEVYQGGRATMFPALGQGFFRGTTPMEFDECSKALCPPSYHVYLGFRYHLDSRTKRERWFSSYLLVVACCVSFRSGETVSFLSPRWLGLRDFREDTPIRDQLYGMIGRRRHVIAMYSPASIVDKLGDPALRTLPYGYGPISVVGTLVAAGDIGR
ncbi:hypothetical protein DY000_02053634 [Brassica cretica]|uniref:Uncharacterized protein n=1 Tax=Brassica cretica TaxID=69181 RepID=A0ABQ7AL30_BRACR|nr:hypothetical protein DY000_02053634 [Brassica cretica]